MFRGLGNTVKEIIAEDYLEENVNASCSVEEVNRLATDFLKSMLNSSEPGSLVQFLLQQDFIFNEEHNAQEQPITPEVFRDAIEKLSTLSFSSPNGVINNNAASSSSTNSTIPNSAVTTATVRSMESSATAKEQNTVRHPYWINRRPLPLITEEEVDQAVRELTEHERIIIEGDFDATHFDGFVLLSSETNRNAPVDPEELRRESETEEEEDNNEDEYIHDFDNDNDEDEDEKDDGEETKDGEEENERKDNRNKKKMRKEKYDKKEMLRNSGSHAMRTEVPDGKSMFFGGHTIELTYEGSAWPDDPLKRDLTPEQSASLAFRVARRVNIKRERYIRQRVREMLIANRVVGDVQQTIADSAVRASNIRRRALDNKVQLLVNQLSTSLQKAVRVLHGLRNLDRCAMAEFGKNPFVTQPWQRNAVSPTCYQCGRNFTLLVHQHHCRRCGLIFCHRCSSWAGVLPNPSSANNTAALWQRLCENCYNKCCEHQLKVGNASFAPPNSFERDGRAPPDPSLAVLANCPVEGNKLDDNFPPFYVVLREEWYALKSTTASGWLNIARGVPYKLCESVQDGATAFSRVTVPWFYQWISGTVNSVKGIHT